MDYHLHNLDSKRFEQLINSICQDVLGMGTISFAEGKDGGRDGKFTGMANRYPSEVSPWTGKFIIQAKHTANPIASCADSDFEKLVKIEIDKIVKLKKKGEIDCYLLFTNRKYSGITGEALVSTIKQKTGLENVAIIGKETINDLYINANKHLVRQYHLDKLAIPFGFSEEEIKEVIISFKRQLPSIKEELRRKAEELKYDFDRIKISEKNKKNGLGAEYFDNEIVGSSLMDFEQIRAFLENPINEDLKEQYFDSAAELSELITIKRANFDAFEEIFSFAYKLVCDGNQPLKGGKRHVRTLLHYMYFECLIGKK